MDQAATIQFSRSTSFEFTGRVDQQSVTSSQKEGPLDTVQGGQGKGYHGIELLRPYSFASQLTPGED